MPSANTPCPCGSGKKYKRCCGTTQKSSITSSTGSVEQVLLLLQHEQWRLAENLLTTLLKTQRRNPTLHYLLGYALLQKGRVEEGVVAMEQAVALGLSDPAGLYHYGCTLASLSRYQEAVQAFQKSLVLKPDFLAAQTNLANCHFELSDFSKAEALFRKTLLVDPKNLLAIHNLGQIFYLTQRIGEAIEYFQRAFETAPNVPELQANLATMQEADNQLDAAENSACSVLNVDPHNITACVALAKVLRRRTQITEALSVLDQAKPDDVAPRSRIAWWSERGLLFEAQGRYREAFEAHANSKATLATTRQSTYDRKAQEAALVRERALLSPARVAAWSLPPGTQIPAPLFIVGFPRSGTTLLEQMLGCHQEVVACGELETVVEQAASRDAYPDNLAALSDRERQVWLAALRRDYLKVLCSHLDSDQIVRYATDKLPLNLMRIGIIRLLFPEARIIHVVRHPLDSVLSAYFTPFLFGNEWSFQLSDGAHLYAQSWQHAQQMQSLPGVHLLRVHYEALVTDPEPVLREVFAFLDLPWEPKCLEFNENKRVARTASYAQVASALYQTSKYRYRHYLDCIDPETLALLEPIIAEAGYAKISTVGHDPVTQVRLTVDDSTQEPLMDLSTVQENLHNPTHIQIHAMPFASMQQRASNGCVIFMTGYSGAGKSTIAEYLQTHLEQHAARLATLLDGDVVRHRLSSELGFSRADRDTNVLRIGYVASEIARHGGIAICAAIAPYADTRAQVRKMVEQCGACFVEVHIATRLETCEQRDVKGLYAKARSGAIPEFTGISDPYEPPEHPEVYVVTEQMTVPLAAQKIIDYLQIIGVQQNQLTDARV